MYIISYSHSNNQQKYNIHTQQSMGNNEPKSRSLSLQVQEAAPWARELSASCKEAPPEPDGQQGRQSPKSNRAEPLAADAKGDQRGMEQHFGVWSSAVSAVVWTLLQLYLENCVLIPSGSFLVNVLAPLLPSVEFSQEPMDGTWLFCLTLVLVSV